jgi:MFS family permease
MLASVAIFTLGSGLCGGATSGPMLIAARAIQGLGSGGITLLNGELRSASSARLF